MQWLARQGAIVHKTPSPRTVAFSTFPVSPPFVKLIYRNGRIMALSTRGEMTVSIVSQDSAEYIMQQKCNILFHNLTGCYSCLECALLNASCYKSLATWITIECENMFFLMRSHNESSIISLDFQTELVNEQFKTKCGKSVVHACSFKLLTNS